MITKLLAITGALVGAALIWNVFQIHQQIAHMRSCLLLDAPSLLAYQTKRAAQKAHKLKSKKGTS